MSFSVLCNLILWARKNPNKEARAGWETFRKELKSFSFSVEQRKMMIRINMKTSTKVSPASGSGMCNRMRWYNRTFIAANSSHWNERGKVSLQVFSSFVSKMLRKDGRLSIFGKCWVDSRRILGKEKNIFVTWQVEGVNKSGIALQKSSNQSLQSSLIAFEKLQNIMKTFEPFQLKSKRLVTLETFSLFQYTWESKTFLKVSFFNLFILALNKFFSLPGERVLK